MTSISGRHGVHEFLPSAIVIKEDAGSCSVLTLASKGERGGKAQEAYLGQRGTMGSRLVYLLSTLLWAAGVFYSYGLVQTEESKAKYLTYFTATDDGDEKQLVSHDTLRATVDVGVNLLARS